VSDPECRHFSDFTPPFGSHHFGSCQAFSWLVPASCTLNLRSVVMIIL
jgi:hypothetical protein